MSFASEKLVRKIVQRSGEKSNAGLTPGQAGAQHAAPYRRLVES